MNKHGQKKRTTVLGRNGKLELQHISEDTLPLYKKYSGFQQLLIISSALQILVGLIAVGLSVLGLITPLWIATLMSMFGSVMAMIGVYLMYDTVKSSVSVDNLCKDAIHRVIKDSN